MNDSKKDFLACLKMQVENRLKSAGITVVKVEAYDKAGEPMVEVTADGATLIAVKRELRIYGSMVVPRRVDPN